VSAYAQPGTGAAGWPGRVRAVLGAWSAALEWQREEERLREAVIADAHVLAERGRSMSREAMLQGHGGMDAIPGLAWDPCSD